MDDVTAFNHTYDYQMLNIFMLGSKIILKTDKKIRENLIEFGNRIIRINWFSEKFLKLKKWKNNQS